MARLKTGNNIASPHHCECPTASLSLIHTIMLQKKPTTGIKNNIANHAGLSIMAQISIMFTKGMKARLALCMPTFTAIRYRQQVSQAYRISPAMMIKSDPPEDLIKNTPFFIDLL
ncbi:MAG: hypothetical protein HZB44_09635 [Actinobacteria bacterium]|nr:hypothetical protein [Actinomycetota bacterium]